MKFKNIREGMGWKIVDDYLLFFVDDKQLILDKNHKQYLKTFKALNRLSEYVAKKFDIKLFDKWKNVEAKDISEYTNRIGISYVTKALNAKALLNLNKQTDDKIARYYTTILEGENVIL